ncbi:MAG: hypothetical protein KAJ32_06265 [Gammaproteobacteria bacterium]|nr:hypothetical protein [Gammaproteobacteria bacterium]
MSDARRNAPLIAEYLMKVCERCKEREHCAELPGICLKIPRILVASIATMVAVLFFTSSL